MSKNRLLIFTTAADRSLGLFQSDLILEKYAISVLFLEQTLAEIQSFLTQYTCDSIYVRDPFNNNMNADEMTAKLAVLFAWQSNQTAKIIDQTTSLAQLIQSEDKWAQYQIYSDYMSPSKLYDPNEPADWDNYLLKKRISSRSHGIYFDQSTLNSLGITPTAQEYMWQKKIPIKEEYRIYSINGEIYPLACLRNPKTPNQKAKLAGKKTIPKAIFEYVSKIDQLQLKTYHFDLVGYDIVETDDGSFILLEQNKSPQIAAFFRETGINLAEKFLLG